MADISRQRRGKHMSEATNERLTMEGPLEAMFSTWSVLRLYNEDQLDPSLSHRGRHTSTNLQMSDSKKKIDLGLQMVT
jgi:hypothetical protein